MLLLQFGINNFKAEIINLFSLKLKNCGLKSKHEFGGKKRKTSVKIDAVTVFGL